MNKNNYHQIQNGKDWITFLEQNKKISIERLTFLQNYKPIFWTKAKYRQEINFLEKYIRCLRIMLIKQTDYVRALMSYESEK